MNIQYNYRICQGHTVAFVRLKGTLEMTTEMTVKNVTDAVAHAARYVRDTYKGNFLMSHGLVMMDLMIYLSQTGIPTVQPTADL